MENVNLQRSNKAEFITPEAEIIKFGTEDVITESNPGGGFYGEWDEEVELPKIKF